MFSKKFTKPIVYTEIMTPLRVTTIINTCGRSGRVKGERGGKGSRQKGRTTFKQNNAATIMFM